MKLYGHPISGNVQRVKALLGILGIKYEDVFVDLLSAAHKKPDFLAMNPLGQVPVLDDGGTVVRDSTAILVYLARKFDASNTWLPADAHGQAAVQQWLSVAVNEVRTGPGAMRLIRLFKAPIDYDQAKAKTEALFGDLFEPHLQKHDWLVGQAATIADLACYPYIARVTEGDFRLDPYPAIRGWLARVEQIDGFSAMPHAADVMAS
ncbi:MAG: glutathione S-transferase family protein [Myxococcota bacterium]